MIPSTTSWTCDVCQGQILKPADGIVAWISWVEANQQGYQGRDIRIIHQYGVSPADTSRKCNFDDDTELKKDKGIVGDVAIEEFMGPDGLMRLLEKLQEKELPETELIEIIKRIHVPGYEAARFLMRGALLEGTIDDSVPNGFWTQQQMQTVLEKKA